MNKIVLIDKVLSGNASEAEKTELDVWISESEANQIEYQDIKLLWENTNDVNNAEDDDHFYDGLQKIKASMQSKHKPSIRNKTVIRYAALLSVLIVLVYLFFKNVETKQQSQYIRFDNASLENVVPVLEDQYNIHIEVENKKILGCQFTGTFYQADSVHDVISSLTGALNLTYVILSDQKYRLIGSGCLSNHP